ncbi:MAG TPA: CPBP family intramembrane metalloprotease [Candidatus Cloacimonetes bacterium]|nr:CPBP family intramembrane metalloprotease [Candidatus Cloacimonadota bacterium]
MNNKAKDLERVALGIVVMFGLFWLYSLVIRPHLPFVELALGIIGIVLLYGVGTGLFVRITKDVVKQPYARKEKSKVSVKTVLLCLLLQCTAFFVMNVLTGITAALGVKPPSTDDMQMTGAMVFMLLVFNPIVEEYVFRHLFATRLLKHGERFYVLASAYCFAVLHGVSMGPIHIVYTFILGLIWGYLTVKSGGIIIAILMHSISNLFNAVIVQKLLEKSVEALAAYSMLIMVLGIIGLIIYLVNRKKVVLDGTSGLIDKQALKDLFSNRGIWIYTVITLIVMVLKAVFK